MMASLTLVPISKEECYKLLQAKGKTPEPLASSSPADAERAAAAKEALGAPRNKITLKLCASSDDVIDVDDDSIESIEPEIVRHASRYQDGSVMAVVSLGRNYSTGIKWVVISRGL